MHRSLIMACCVVLVSCGLLGCSIHFPDIVPINKHYHSEEDQKHEQVVHRLDLMDERLEGIESKLAEEQME